MILDIAHSQQCLFDFEKDQLKFLPWIQHTFYIHQIWKKCNDSPPIGWKRIERLKKGIF